MSEFFQNNPEIGNQFRDDIALQSFLKNVVPADVHNQIKPHLDQVGADAAGSLLQLSRQAEAEEPEITHFDAWGRRIDQLKLSPAWHKIEAYASTNGIVASGYERKQGEWSRVYQMLMLHLFHPSSAFVSCPLAMTDGAARLLEVHAPPALRDRALSHLLSRDPAQFWTSGQWMTERTGGSDVGLSETTATKSAAGYQLRGTKWFTSATKSQMAMTLARIDGAPAGGKGLSLFYLETGSDGGGSLRDIQILRLKDKLGTRAMPTAELLLTGTPATLVGEPGTGVRTMATLFNITRIYNSVCAVGQMRRSLAWAQAFAKVRTAFGKTVDQHLLMQQEFADTQLMYEGNFLLTMHLAHLLGKDETGSASATEKAVLRLLTPVSKLYTGKNSLQIVSAMLEVFAGAGYCEDTHIPRLLRDAQVFSIWEGTTNVLSLDMLRALQKECSLDVFVEHLRQVSEKAPTSLREPIAVKIKELQTWAKGLGTSSAALAVEFEAHSRVLAFAAAELMISTLFAANAGKDPRQALLAQRWLARMPALKTYSAAERDASNLILQAEA